MKNSERITELSDRIDRLALETVKDVSSVRWELIEIREELEYLYERVNRPSWWRRLLFRIGVN